MGGLNDHFLSQEMSAERYMEDVPFGYSDVREAEESFGVEGRGKTDVVFVDFENT